METSKCDRRVTTAEYDLGGSFYSTGNASNYVLTGYCKREAERLIRLLLRGVSNPFTAPTPRMETERRESIAIGGNMPKFNRAHEASSIQRISAISAVAELHIPLLYQISINIDPDTETKDAHGAEFVNSESFPTAFTFSTRNNSTPAIGLTLSPKFNAGRMQYV